MAKAKLIIETEFTFDRESKVGGKPVRDLDLSVLKEYLKSGQLGRMTIVKGIKDFFFLVKEDRRLETPKDKHMFMHVIEDPD